MIDELDPEADKIVLVMDNLNTPKHVSWLNMAETELATLSKQCLIRRIAPKQILNKEVCAWSYEINDAQQTVDW